MLQLTPPSRIFLALAQRDPSNTQWQRDLSVSHDKVGDVFVARGDLDGALAAYQDSRKIHQTLAQRDPSNVTWQLDMVELFDKLASLADTSSELGKQEAKVHYEQALAILRRLETESRLPPNCMDWTRTIETKISPQNCKEWIGIIEAKMKALGE